MYLINDIFIEKGNLLKKNNSDIDNFSFDITNDLKNTRSSSCFYSPRYNKSFIFKRNKGNIINFKDLGIKSKLIRATSQPEYISFYNSPLKIQAKGTNLSKQFYRNNYYQVPNLFKKFQNNINDSSMKTERLIKNYKSQDNIKTDEKIKNDYKEISKIGIKERIFKPLLWDNVDKKDLINQRDKLMPKGLQLYEKILKKENKKYFKNNYVIKELPNGKIIPTLIRDLFKQRIEESNIFFQNKNINKKESLNEISKNKEKAMEEFYSSDIFNKKITPFIIKKSGEKKFFKDKQIDTDKKINIENIKYMKNSESTKGWGPIDPLPCLLNYSSLKYNPINPSKKNFCKTKESIFNECDKIYKGYNPIKKQKSLSEFIDLTNVHASNVNNDYTNILSKNPNVFKRKDDMCSELYKLHYSYKNITEKPFYRFLSNSTKNNIINNEDT